MGVTNFNKEVTSSQIECGGSFNVRLSLTAEPDITSNPTDIVLILDQSGSMAGLPLASMKLGAKAFIDIIDEATDSSQDGVIGGGSRIGIVGFADIGNQVSPLTTSVSDLKAGVDSLFAGGSTNHADAFTQALDLFDGGSNNAKIMVMFTDGVTTTGGDPNAVATLAKSQGVTIYIIGLSGNGGIDVAALESWASSPPSSYVAITPNAEELEELFEGIAENIVLPGATNIVINDVVLPCFNITSVSSPSKGTATLVDNRTVEWRIDELGVTASEGATFEFTVQHVGPCSGETAVNQEITYTDSEGNVVNFPSPTVDVDCDIIVNPEPCPEPVDLLVDTCSDTIEFDAGDIVMQSLGRIVNVDVTLRNVCPGKRVALAVILNEVDSNGLEHKRGMKTMTIPSHTREGCRDVSVRCIKFVLPEDIDVSDTTDSICNQRDFRVRFICHYIDNDFECCDEVEDN